MTVSIRDTDSLFEISPDALSAFARASGWDKVDTYGDYSDIYVSEDLPEIIIPRTQIIDDYSRVVAQLIDIFSRTSGEDKLLLYRKLITADRDVIRVRASGDDDGTISLNDGVELVQGTRDMYLAAACSLLHPRPSYRAGANKKANEYLDRIRMGQTEQGSFVVTLLTPAVSLPTQQLYYPFQRHHAEPVERRITMRLDQALDAIPDTINRTVKGDVDAIYEAVEYGISANLLEALARLVEPFDDLNISMSWALTRPMEKRREPFRFEKDDAPNLKNAARSFRERQVTERVSLIGLIQRLARDRGNDRGTVTIRAQIEGRVQSVRAVLSQSDYERAILAHQSRTQVIAQGDLERIGQRWHLSNANIAYANSERDRAP